MNSSTVRPAWSTIARSVPRGMSLPRWSETMVRRVGSSGCWRTRWLPLERTWTKKEALVSFKNPKTDVIVYLEADTNVKAFDAPPVLTVSVGGKTGMTLPIENSEVFLKKVRVKAADLGSDEWVDMRIAMNQSFVPKLKGVNATDDRELGVMIYHLYVGEVDKLGQVPGVADATPVALPAATKAMAGSAGTTPSKTATTKRS